jgi:hypothetical protein
VGKNTQFTCSIWPHHASLPVLFASLPVTSVFAAVSPLAHSLAPFSTLLPLARVNVTFRGLEHTFAFCFSSKKFSFINITIRFAETPLAVLASVGPQAFILPAIIPGLDAEAMRPVVPIITLSSV